VGRKAYSPEFKSQVTKEAIETNNTALVASKHGLALVSLSIMMEQ
jgi:transposase-like protein